MACRAWVAWHQALLVRVDSTALSEGHSWAGLGGHLHTPRAGPPGQVLLVQERGAAEEELQLGVLASQLYRCCEVITWREKLS